MDSISFFRVECFKRRSLIEDMEAEFKEIKREYFKALYVQEVLERSQEHKRFTPTEKSLGYCVVQKKDFLEYADVCFHCLDYTKSCHDHQDKLSRDMILYDAEAFASKCLCKD